MQKFLNVTLNLAIAKIRGTFNFAILGLQRMADVLELY